MDQEIKGLVSGIRLITAVIGVVGAIAAIATDQVIAVINMFGFAGMAMLIFGAQTWYSENLNYSNNSDPTYIRVKRTFLVMIATGAVFGAFMYFGRPMDEWMKSLNIFTFIGAVNIVALSSLVSLGLARIIGPRDKMKKCPECANEVLAEARKCQFCQHRFDGQQSA